jgi:hypothetical protein
MPSGRLAGAGLQVTVMRTDIFWAAERWPGLEHLTFRDEVEGPVLDGLVVARLDGEPMRIHYQIRCRPDWHAHTVRLIDLVARRERRWVRPGPDSWTAEDGTPLPGVSGASDIDLAISPATNTLPIRRLRLEDSREIAVLYVAFPSLAVGLAQQRYTRLADNGGHAVYRYQSGSFQADLPVDDHGLVLDYPGVWRRV